MADFPQSPLVSPVRGILRTANVGQPFAWRLGSPAAAAWPAANRAIYVPVVVETPVLVTQMCIYVGAAAGNVDVGIYDITKTRLVSMGSTAVAGTNALQLLDITDTTLVPGNYWLGMVCSTVTTLTLFRWNPAGALYYQAEGIQQEALGATTLPATATFANPASGYLPCFGCLIDKLL